ncbi:MAG: hypothetical protein AB7F88_05920 [Pyrinomonadaceae bacterium]
MMHPIRKLVLLVFAAAVLTGSASAQTRKRKPAVKRSPPAASAVPDATPPPGKRNQRPDNESVSAATIRPASASTSSYKYEFSQPNFVIGWIAIEHDENGSGTISFRKKDSEELITDPIRVSPKALGNINAALAALNFLSSDENYQYEKDFSHLGNIKFAYNTGSNSREVTFNYTTNKFAKALMDEYRKLGNQYIWVFDIKLSRANQPLEAPRLFDTLDSLVRRNEISDPDQLEPFLRELANDESIPLIARNHASRLVQRFEKEREKEERKKAKESN